MITYRRMIIADISSSRLLPQLPLGLPGTFDYHCGSHDAEVTYRVRAKCHVKGMLGHWAMRPCGACGWLSF